MTTLEITDRSGNVSEIIVSDNISLMEAIRDNGLDELLALCGGCCSCATCHVYIQIDDASKISPLSDDENDLLDSSEHRTDRSRLSCQISLNDRIEHMKVTIAPQD
ncbi:2Fe-2S iron-sulfur cluster-binding protein [Sphingobium sp. Sx8-8]|uniref:2Fe-2S iron-sulfur cluster-binding protein n=1 Tax=Sphingobium sp. Sx8-8 TaxID=2933617 RepID=UPI001F579618|nr:2Fe-2S iron-sulfur cluster-binding protein [Sphingobium sp. Sx8-8]